MKWVQAGVGRYKMVPDNDPRPEDEAFAKRQGKPGIPYISFKPSWGVFEPAMHSDDPKTQQAATDLFLAERARETAQSAKARRWEEGRKREWAKNKPAWRKKQQTNV